MITTTMTITVFYATVIAAVAAICAIAITTLSKKNKTTKSHRLLA